ncbi:54S ribosomal protein L41, mitochondrial [Candida viswanathii]|uniref:Large ribosomal subunit protein uL23m n=1 Tax=Candida viswanathii TaxID=5486 RepID=A0A367XRS6_9ASCO|nr:54S ribosomal protein L41, mitochondrial [Candida viswanathii]
MESSSRSVASSMMKVLTRSLHYKPLLPSKYPQVNVKDLELHPKKNKDRKQREPIIAQSSTETLFPSAELAKMYIEAGKPVPRRFRDRMTPERAREQFQEFQEKLESEEPHFTIGGNKVYFPQGRICLLRPNAKHTPYQAKFLVPKSMNRMDLRDYLWHIYGLRALNVTVQLQPAKWKRGPMDNGRYRGPQLKKMTVDMAEPFVWPDVDQASVERAESRRLSAMEIVDHNTAVGSDVKKPLTAHDGLYVEKVVPQKLIPHQVSRTARKEIREYKKLLGTKDNRQLLAQFLGL